MPVANSMNTQFTLRGLLIAFVVFSIYLTAATAFPKFAFLSGLFFLDFGPAALVSGVLACRSSRPMHTLVAGTIGGHVGLAISLTMIDGTSSPQSWSDSFVHDLWTWAIPVCSGAAIMSGISFLSESAPREVPSVRHRC